MKDLCVEGYKALLFAVIEYACKEYVNVLTKLKRNPMDLDLWLKKRDCEEFFLGDKFKQYSDLLGLADSYNYICVLQDKVGFNALNIISDIATSLAKKNIC